VIPCASASPTARLISAPISASGISSATGIGLATTMPPAMPRPHFARIAAATSAGSSSRSGEANPLERE